MTTTGTVTAIQPGDVYCPRCGSSQIDMTVRDGEITWECGSLGCQHRWDMPYDYEAMDWRWPEGQEPFPGCPWCGTHNIRVHVPSTDLPASPGNPGSPSRWTCNRVVCGRSWVGGYVVRITDDPDRRLSRWTIRIPTRLVPFTWYGDDGAGLVRWGAGTILR